MINMRILRTLLSALLTIMLSHISHADTLSTMAVGTVTHLAGVLSVRRADGSTKILATHSQITAGDTLITERESYARIKFVDNAEIVLRPTTQLEITHYVYDVDNPQRDIVAIKLVDGGFRAVTGLIGKRNHDAVLFTVPTGEIQVRGTHFGALFCQNDCGGVPAPAAQSSTADSKVPPTGQFSTATLKASPPPPPGLYVSVTDGQIVVANKGGAQQFQAGQFGYVANFNTPPVPLPPSRGIPLTIPPSISRNIPNSATIGAAKANACVVQ